MKKRLRTSLLSAEIAAFGMLLLLFFLNTNKPYLLLIPIAGVIGGCFLFKSVLKKRESVSLIIILPILLGGLIAGGVTGLLYIL